MADPYFIGILNKLNISAKMVFKEWIINL
jgi:hypothetical protein